MSTNTFNIYCLRKNNDLIDQATVEETTNTYTIVLKPLPSQAMHMGSYLNELFNLMIKYEKDNVYEFNITNVYKTTRYEYMNGEFVEATIFHRVLMRKGSYFYVYQKSDRGTRFLLYALDRVHHSSVSLGFTMHIPNVIDERKEMKIILSEKMNGLTPELIANDSLYFI